MSHDTATLTEEYMALFREANPGRPEPTLTYERGWFVFRYASSGRIPHRVRRTDVLQMMATIRDRKTAPDPRDPDHTRSGIFVHHNCWKCHDGKMACANGNPIGCEYPHARND